MLIRLLREAPPWRKLEMVDQLNQSVKMLGVARSGKCNDVGRSCFGQDHIVGEGKLLRRAIQADRLFSSILLWGPLRVVIDKAIERRKLYQKKTILFGKDVLQTLVSA